MQSTLDFFIYLNKYSILPNAVSEKIEKVGTFKLECWYEEYLRSTIHQALGRTTICKENIFTLLYPVIEKCLVENFIDKGNLHFPFAECLFMERCSRLRLQ